MNDILFSQNSKQQHGKNYDITKHDTQSKQIQFALSFYPFHSRLNFHRRNFFSVAFKKKSLFLSSTYLF